MPNRTRTQARGGFRPLKGLKWTAETEVEFIKELVQNREQLFAKHRLINDTMIEASNWEILERLVPWNESDAFRPHIDRYSEFCTMSKISTFPLSHSTIAIFLFAKCSHLNGCYQTHLENLRILLNATSQSWENVDGYEDFEDSRKAEQAIRDFMKERGSARVRAVKKPVVCVTHADTSESESQEEASSSDSDTDSSESEPSGSNLGEREATRGRSMPTPSGSAVHQLVVPNLPRVNDRFSSTNALFIACYKSILPIFGHGVILSERTDGIATIKCGRNHGVYDKTREGRCHWELGAEVCSSTGEAVVKQALSHLVHNHGPSSKILKNPNYRPVIINPIIREAFGMDPLASGKRREKETSQSSAQARPRAVQRPSPTKQVNSIGNSRPPQDNERSYPAASPFSLPSRSSQHVNGVVRPRLASLSSLSRPLAPSSFSDQLESFLEGLDPSLSGLAPILSEEGIDSLKTLVLICSMSPLTIDHFIESLCEKAPLIFLGYLKLFGKLLKQAQEGEYNT